MDNLPGRAVEPPKPTLEQALAEECYDSDWLTENTPRPRDWLIKPILPAVEICAISGAPGSGKTYLAIILAIAVARGEFNGTACKKARVMYVTREESRSEIHRRIKTQTQGREPIPTAFICKPWSNNAPLHADDSLSDIGEAIFARAETLGVELLVFEIARFFAGSEIDRQQVNSFFRGVVTPRAKRAGAPASF